MENIENTKIESNDLTDDEKNIVQNYIKGIDIFNSQSFLQYGSSIQNKTGQVSEVFLENMKTYSNQYITETLDELIKAIEDFGVKTKEKKGFAKIFSGEFTKEKLVDEYKKTNFILGQIEKDLEKDKRQIMKNLVFINRIMDENEENYKNINYFVVGGNLKLAEAKEVLLPNLENTLASSKDEMEKLRINELKNNIDKFEKKVYDLTVTRVVSLQLKTQIEIFKNTQETLLNKIDFSLNTSIPLWKNQISILLGLKNSEIETLTNKKLSEVANKSTLENKSSIEKEDLSKVNEELLKSVKDALNVSIETEHKIVSVKNN